MARSDWYLFALRTLYAVAGLATIGWGAWMAIIAHDEEVGLLSGAGVLMVAAAAWIRSTHPIRRAIALVGVFVLTVPVAGVAFLLMFGSVVSGGRIWWLNVAPLVIVGLSVAVAVSMWSYRNRGDPPDSN